MGQYCPKCFSDSLSFPTSAIVHVVINGVRMDTGRILFRPGEKDDIFKKDLKTKIKEFFSWYGSLQNKTPIKTVKVFSNDYKCPNRCSIRDANLSVVNDLVTPNELMGLLQTVAQNYDVSLDISLKDLI